MKSRRQAREAVLQLLYQCDTLGDFSEDCLNLYFEIFQTCVEDEEDVEEKISNTSSDENILFCREVALGVINRHQQIDAEIEKASTHWSVNRMSRVDRNILRIATYEILQMQEIPPKCSINEAIEIAKRYGNEDSANFINGVLHKVLASSGVEQSSDSEVAQKSLNSPKKVKAIES
jgi:N utilization substance protein B